MANMLLWKLLNGEAAPSDSLDAGLLFSGLFTAGFCVLAFRMDWERALRAQGDRADRLEQDMLQAADTVQESRIRSITATDGTGNFCVLLSFASRRDYSVQTVQRLCHRLRDAFSSLGEVGVEAGIGGFCICYEMIPFSRREAAADLAQHHATKSVRAVLRYVDEHYTEPELDNARIAKACFLNYSYMCTHFHHEMGLTLTSYLRQYRMRRGVAYLGEAGTSIQTAAEHVGYTDAKYFSKCFKREFDMTPGEFQKRVSRLL